jgi:hypothetical protein
LEERIFLKTPIRDEEKRLGVALIELYDIIGSGSNDEDSAAQSSATPVSLRGRPKSVSDEISLTAASSALRAGETYL